VASRLGFQKNLFFPQYLEKLKMKKNSGGAAPEILKDRALIARQASAECGLAPSGMATIQAYAQDTVPVDYSIGLYQCYIAIAYTWM